MASCEFSCQNTDDTMNACTLVSDSGFPGSAGMTTSTALVSTAITPMGTPPSLRKRHQQKINPGLSTQGWYSLKNFKFMTFHGPSLDVRDLKFSCHSIKFQNYPSFRIVLRSNLNKLVTSVRQTSDCLIETRLYFILSLLWHCHDEFTITIFHGRPYKISRLSRPGN